MKACTHLHGLPLSRILQNMEEVIAVNTSDWAQEQAEENKSEIFLKKYKMDAWICFNVDEPLNQSKIAIVWSRNSMEGRSVTTDTTNIL